MLTILHLSDLHWSPSNANDLKIVVDALLADISRMIDDEGVRPDLVVFSGDLAMGGDDISWFQSAYDALLLPLKELTGLGYESIFVAPGNHDIARESVRARPNLENSLRTLLTTRENINSFIDTPCKLGSERDLSLERLQNFYDAHDTYHSGAITSSPFLRTFHLDVRGTRVGVACLNSAWRASGEADNVDLRHLMIGERAIDQAVTDLVDCDFRIAVHHHPIDWLDEADRITSDFLTRKYFNLSCCGHTHVSRPFISRDPAGACVTSQAGSVYAQRDWFNGYQFIQVDLVSRDIKFIVRQYIHEHRRFDIGTTVCPAGTFTITNTCGDSPRKIDQIELFIRNGRDTLKDTVAEQLNFFRLKISADAIARQFVAPALSPRLLDSIESEDVTPTSGREITLDDALSMKESLIILGPGQSGKSSIALFAAYRLAFDNWECPTIPVCIDCRTFKFNDYALRRSLLTQYGGIPAAFDLGRALKNGSFTIIFDNVTNDGGVLSSIRSYMDKEEMSSCRWILVGSPNTDGLSPDRPYNEMFPDFKKFHIKSLNRGRIRALAKRWYGDSPAKADDAYDLVMTHLIRDGLPRTPYIVSLLLWAAQQNVDLVKINETILLGNLVDHLLDKANFRLSKRGVLNPVGKEITLQNLAHYLSEHKGVVEENRLVQYLIDFFEKKRLPFLGGDVLERLIECGILKRDLGLISFKYRCFQQYFYACLLRNDSSLLERHLTGISFLRFRREIELLSGMRQQNADIIERIIATVDQRLPTRFVASKMEEFDVLAMGELRIGTTKADLNRIRRTRLTDDQVDEMMDEADRRAFARGEEPITESLNKADGNIAVAAKAREAQAIASDEAKESGPLMPATHMAAIDLLARVIRNSDFTDYDVKGEATRYVLQSWIRVYVIVIEEICAMLRAVGKDTGDSLTDQEFQSIKYIMAKFIFNAVGEAIIEQISSPLMSGTIKTLVTDKILQVGETILSLFLLENADVPDWQSDWCNMIGDRDSSGFIVECFVERLMYLCSTKALDTIQGERVDDVVDAIERRLDWSKAQKASVFEQIREAASIAAVRERQAGADNVDRPN